MLEIPLTNAPAQEFSITIGDNTYGLRVIFNSRGGFWSLNIAQDNLPIVNGIGLLGGVDIVKQYPINISNVFIVNLDDDTQDATVDNLGTTCKLLVLTDAELNG